MRRQRNEEKYRNTISRNKKFSPEIDEYTAERVRRYCKAKDISKTKFVIECVNNQLDILEPGFYESLTKEELLKLILK